MEPTDADRKITIQSWRANAAGRVCGFLKKLALTG
jgi:hypothetical protein